MASAESVKPVKRKASGSRLDNGWEHGFDVDGNGKKVRCNYCQKIYSGGIFRLKHHLAQTHSNVEICQLVPSNVRDLFRKKNVLNPILLNLPTSSIFTQFNKKNVLSCPHKFQALSKRREIELKEFYLKD